MTAPAPQNPNPPAPVSERPLTNHGPVLAVVLAIFFFVAILAALFGGTASKKTESHKAPVPTPTTGSSSPAATCWSVQLDPNRGNNVLSNGVTGTPSQVTKKLLAAAQKDPRVLQALWNVSPEGQKAPIDDWHKLVDNTGECYSQKGQALWHETAIVWEKADASAAVAPKKGCNFYVVPNGNASCKVESIVGDRSGTKYVFEDGTVIFVMHRCGNPVIPGPAPKQQPQPTPSHTTTPPTRTTPHPTPTPSHTTTPPAKCPPGQIGTPPNCTAKNGAPSAQPTQPPSATGTNPAPVPVPTTDANGQPTTQPTSSQCYDPNTGYPVSPGTPGAWCS